MSIPSYHDYFFSRFAPEVAMIVINTGPEIGDSKTIALFWANRWVGNYWIPEHTHPKDQFNTPAVDKGVLTLHGDAPDMWELRIELKQCEMAVKDNRIVAINYGRI